MLSRRNIRIKVMQLLYAKNRDMELTLNDLHRQYDDYGKKTLELYLLNFHQLLEVAHYAVKDEINRRAKHVPSQEDKAFTAKLYKNALLEPFLLRGGYSKAIQKFRIDSHLQEDNTRLFYQKFLETDVYKQFLAKAEPSQDDCRYVLLEMYKFLYNNESFAENMEDFSTSWIDDDSLIIGAIKKTIKALPSENEFHHDFNEEDNLTMEFGAQLLIKSYKNDEVLLEDIKPMLKNWDAERVATIDMILMKMALAELLYFPTIPTKVTINEYVDISKMYSTDKSKDFVNGILDRMMKKLKEEDRIVKEGRGLIE
jgi:transcription antitermination protein NusB